MKESIRLFGAICGFAVVLIAMPGAGTARVGGGGCGGSFLGGGGECCGVTIPCESCYYEHCFETQQECRNCEGYCGAACEVEWQESCHYIDDKENPCYPYCEEVGVFYDGCACKDPEN